MPQFDKVSFFTQILWLSISFFSFYFIILFYYLPSIATVLKSRKKIFAVYSKEIQQKIFKIDRTYYTQLIGQKNFLNKKFK
jgi:F0F1-type ATP synthase membrane subunit b/b'